MTVLSVPFSLLGASFWSECWLEGTRGGAVFHQPDREVPGETLDLGLPDRTMTVLLVSFSLMGASFWSKCWLEGTRGGAVFHLLH